MRQAGQHPHQVHFRNIPLHLREARQIGRPCMTLDKLANQSVFDKVYVKAKIVHLGEPASVGIM